MTHPTSISLRISGGRLLAEIDGRELEIQQYEPKCEHVGCARCHAPHGRDVWIMPRGLRGLIEILRERETAQETIGNFSNPTSSDINSLVYLSEVAQKRRQQERNAQDQALAELWAELDLTS